MKKLLYTRGLTHQSENVEECSFDYVGSILKILRKSLDAFCRYVANRQTDTIKTTMFDAGKCITNDIKKYILNFNRTDTEELLISDGICVIVNKLL